MSSRVEGARGRTHKAPNVKTPAMASRFLLFRFGVRNRTIGVAKMAKSHTMFVAVWASNMASKDAKLANPKP